MLARLEDQSARKINFIMTWQVSGICKTLVKLALGLGDFNGHVRKRIDRFKGVHGGYGIGKKMLREEEYWNFVMKRSCGWQIHG